MVNTRAQAAFIESLRLRRLERRKARSLVLMSRPTTPEPEHHGVAPLEEGPVVVVEEEEEDVAMEEDEKIQNEDWLVDDEQDVEMNDNASYHTESEDSSEDEDMDVDEDTDLTSDEEDSNKGDRSPAPSPESGRSAHDEDQLDQAEVQHEEDSLDLITRLLVKEKRDILIVDENDTYSITLALAAQRGSFDGIWCSRYDRTEFEPLGLLNLLRKNRSAAEARDTKCLLCDDPDAPYRGSWYEDMRAKLMKLSLPSLARLDLNFWANQLVSHCPPEVPKGLIFLNFPYIKLSGREPGYLQSFLFDCYQVQEEGDVVLVSLTNDQMWYGHYDVPALVNLGERLGYEHMEENTFVRDECQHFGYHHRTYKRAPEEVEEDIHEHVVPDCTIHVFVKGPKPNPRPNRSWIAAKTYELERQPPRPQTSWPYTRPSRPSGTVYQSRSVVQHPMTPPRSTYARRSYRDV